MPAPLVDFHCHLDLYPDHEAEVRRCDSEGVFALTVTTTPRAWERNRAIASKTKYVRAALGLHPQLVHERADEIELWEELLPQARYVGEVGLDAGPRYYKSLDSQKAVFERVLKACADAKNKILTIHSVRATALVLDMVEKYLRPSDGLIVLHWFTGTAAEARRAAALGAYFSINAQMLIDERRRAIVAAMPRDRLLTETDGPFTTTDNKPNRPDDVRHAVNALASLLGNTASEMQQVVADNLKRVVSFGD
jgi:TatD DNase family protein